MLYLLLLHSLRCVSGELKEITTANYDAMLAEHEIVFLYIYADWCRFTEKVTPDFIEFAKKVDKEINDPGKILIAKMNYERNHKKIDELTVTKFPTFKLYRYGVMAFREYRGQRTVDDWFKFIVSQIESPIISMEPGQSPAEISKSDRFVIGRFNDNTTNAFREFKKAASVLRDDCSFILVNDPKFGGEELTEALFFGERKNPALVALRDADNLLEKARHFCVPLIRKLTYDNAEDFADLGRPLLILFEQPSGNNDIRNSLETTLSLPEMRMYHGKFTFVYANGSYFAHALSHVDKTINDLPLLAIDSLRHMYAYSGQLGDVSQMKKFFDYFLDGTLHRMYHFGQLGTMVLIQAGGGLTDAPTTPETNEPPKSAIRLLGPSKHQYTFKDEL